MQLSICKHLKVNEPLFKYSQELMNTIPCPYKLFLGVGQSHLLSHTYLLVYSTLLSLQSVVFDRKECHV